MTVAITELILDKLGTTDLNPHRKFR